MYTTLEWVALGIWIVVIVTIVYGIVAIHDIPARVARNNNHPHVDAIEAAGWVSLFMLHALWPFLWIWAFYYKPDVESKKQANIDKRNADIEKLESQIGTILERLTSMEIAAQPAAAGSNTTPENGDEA